MLAYDSSEDGPVLQHSCTQCCFALAREGHNDLGGGPKATMTKSFDMSGPAAVVIPTTCEGRVPFKEALAVEQLVDFIYCHGASGPIPASGAAAEASLGGASGLPAVAVASIGLLAVAVPGPLDACDKAPA